MKTDNNHSSHRSGEQPLESWKQIASYLQRDSRTVARWEKEEGLPVHRLRHHRRASVYAYPSELERWKKSRKPVESSDPPPWTWTRTTWVMGIAIWAVARGPILNPPSAHVEAAKNDGTTVRKVWSGNTIDPIILADMNGRFTVYTDLDTGQLMLLNLATGESEKHPQTTSWATGICNALRLSPDGEKVACSWIENMGGRNELRVLSLEGGEPITLIAHAEGQRISPYDWSHDGRQVLVTVFRADNTIQIGVVSFPEGEPRVVKSLEWRRPRNLSFSPDGRYIAYDVPIEPRSHNRDVFLLAEDGSSEVALVEHPAADYSPYWLPDSSGVLFFSDRNDEHNAWLQPVKRPLGSPRLVRKETQQTYPLGFDESGAFMWGQITGDSGLYLGEVDFDEGRFVGEPRRMRLRLGRNDAGQPLWSPDGKFLNYPLHLGSRRADEVALVIREVETEKERVIYPNLQYLFTRYWFPQGDAFLVESRDARGRQGIFRVDVQTGAEIAIYRNTKGSEVNGFCRRPQLAPDERSLFCTDQYTNGQLKLYRHDLESGEDVQLYRWEGPEHLGWHHLSPDGRRLGLLRRDPKNPANGQLLVLPSDGGEPKVLHSAENVGYMHIFNWTPDSRWVLVAQLTKGQESIAFYQVSVDGRTARPLQPYPGKRLNPTGRGFDVHPDGRTVAMQIQAKEGSEIWALENFGGQEVPSE